MIDLRYVLCAERIEDEAPCKATSCPESDVMPHQSSDPKITHRLEPPVTR